MKRIFLAILFLFLFPVLVYAQDGGGDPLASPGALVEFLRVYGLPAAQAYVAAWVTVLLVQRVKPVLEKLGLPQEALSEGRKVVLTLVSWGVSVGGFFLLDQFTVWTAQLGQEKWAYLVGVIALTYRLYKQTYGSITLPMPPAVELVEREGG